MLSVEEFLDQAHSALAMGELAQASELYRKTTELDPNFFDGWQGLGVTLIKLECYPQAIEALQHCAKLQPNDQMTYTSLSIAYARNMQIEEAEAMAAKARILSWGGKLEKKV